MQLHYAPGTIAVASAIALYEAALPFTPVRVDFAAAAQTKPDYLALNPKGRVPALVHEGHVLTETGAILDYIAAIAPKAGLMPSDPLQAHHVREAMFYLASTMHVNHAHKMRGNRWADQTTSFEDMTAKVPQTMTASAQYVEDHVLRGRYVLGDVFSAADPYLFVVCTWLPGDGVDLTPFPRINAFMQAMEARPSVKWVRTEGILP